MWYRACSYPTADTIVEGQSFRTGAGEIQDSSLHEKPFESRTEWGLGEALSESSSARWGSKQERAVCLHLCSEISAQPRARASRETRF